MTKKDFQISRHWPVALKAAAVTVLIIGLLGSAPSWALDKVSVRLVWVHQAQSAGFYMAQDQGVYRAHGLEVDIKPGGPGISFLKEITQGRCDFAGAWLSAAIEARTQGVPLLHLAQVIQRSALLLVAFKCKGFKTIKDLNGRRVGLWENQFSLAPFALFKRDKIKVKETPQNTSMAPLLNGALDAASAMRYNEYHQLYQAGVDPDQLVVFDFAEMGLNFPEDGIYALESTWRKKPDMCRRFVQATLEGWRRAFAQPEKALDAVMRRVGQSNLASNKSHQRWMLKVMKEIITHRVSIQNLGYLDPQDFAMVNQVLIDKNIITSPVSLGQFAMPAWRK